MKKQIYNLAAAVILCVIFLTGCAQSKLSDKFDETQIKTQAEKAIAYFNERDYQSILDMGSEALKVGITADQFAKASDPYLDKCGDFEKISKTVVLGNSDKETGDTYGGVVMIGTYEKGRIQFTIAFDEEMKLVQFLIK